MTTPADNVGASVGQFKLPVGLLLWFVKNVTSVAVVVVVVVVV